MRRAVITLLILAAVTTLACQRPTPGERPGPDRPTVGPTFPRFGPDVARTVLLGVKLLNADGDTIPGRISIYADAADTKGGRGVAAGKFPINATVDSGWEYQIQVARTYQIPVVFVLKATAIGLDPGEQVECYFQDGDPPFGIYDRKRNRVPHDAANPHAPRVVNCAFSLLPIQQ